jgi:hypothetical protein
MRQHLELTIVTPARMQMQMQMQMQGTLATRRNAFNAGSPWRYRQ